MMWTSRAHTETGSVRSLNEDSILALDEEQLWLVADGMGGHDSGDFASQLVSKRFRSFQHPKKQGLAVRTIDTVLSSCNDELRQKAANDAVSVIGCTVAVLMIHRGNAVCSWSGDSRIYRIRNNTIKQLTNDHSYLAYLRDAPRENADAPFPEEVPNGDALTTAIGGEQTAYIEHCVYPAHHQDQFVVCTDGLYKEMHDAEVLSIVSNADDSKAATEQLAKLYRDRGARDNVG